MGKPRLLDLFCGTGGAARGYQLAGFHVIGVDNKPQPRYAGDEFILADAIEVMESEPATFRFLFDAVHASPPCQAFTVYGNNKAHVRQDHPNHIPFTRDVLRRWGMPYVIENVPGAPLVGYVQLCGTSFGIEVRRHRWFESNVEIPAPPCDHGRFTERKYPGSSNRPNGRTVCNVGEYRVPLWQQKLAMQVDWVKSVGELSQMVPPAFTHHIGKQLMAAILERAA